MSLYNGLMLYESFNYGPIYRKVGRAISLKEAVDKSSPLSF